MTTATQFACLACGAISPTTIHDEKPRNQTIHDPDLRQTTEIRRFTTKPDDSRLDKPSNQTIHDSETNKETEQPKQRTR